MGSIVITYNAPGQRPLSVATIDDPDLLRAAAGLAIQQAEDRASATADSDTFMARLQSLEVTRLKSALAMLVPGLFDLSKSQSAIQ